METPELSRTRLKELARILDKRYRKSSRLFLIEGELMIREWLSSGFTAEWIVSTGAFAAAHRPLLKAADGRTDVWYLGRTPDLKRLSDTETPPPVVAAIRQPAINETSWLGSAGRAVLLLDRISDPGNLGTMVRTADWFGVTHVACSTSCVEFYNPKAVRSTMGSVFRTVVIANVQLDQLMDKLAARGYRNTAAVVRDGHNAGTDWANGPTALVIGSESHGISPEVEARCDRRVSISRRGGAESLNAAVACGILLYELGRHV
jgi:TrmH family RNA methyltransferase